MENIAVARAGANHGANKICSSRWNQGLPGIDELGYPCRGLVWLMMLEAFGLSILGYQLEDFKAVG